MNVLEPVLIIGGALLISAAVAWLRSRLANRHLAQVERGELTTVTCRLRGAAPYPAARRGGSLRIGPDQLLWRPRCGWGRSVDLAAEQASVRGVHLWEQQNVTFAVIACRDRNNVDFELTVYAENGELVAESLGRRTAVGAPAVHRSTIKARLAEHMPWWAAVLGAIGLLGALAGGYVAGAGKTTTATVTAAGTDSCRVAWADPWDGRRQSAEVDCSDATVGQQVTVFALPAPLRGEANSPGEHLVVIAIVEAVVLVPALLGAGWDAVSRRRRRRAVAPHQPTTAEPTVDSATGRAPESWDDVPEVSENDLSWAHLADVARLRAQLEGWGTDTTLSGAGPAVRPDRSRTTRFWWQERGLRRLGYSSLLTSVALLMFATLATLAGSGWWVSQLWMATGSTARTQAQVVNVDEWQLPPLMPHEVAVSFPIASGTSRATVAWSGSAPKPGDLVQVDYATSHPGHARSVDHDGLLRGVGLSAGVAAVCLGFAGHRLLGGTRMARRIAAVGRRRSQAAPMRYVLLRAIDGTPLLLLFNDYDAALPRLVSACVENPLGTVPAAGTALVSGEVVEGGLVVARMGDYTLWPIGEAAEPTAEFVVGTINGGR